MPRLKMRVSKNKHKVCILKETGDGSSFFSALSLPKFIDDQVERHYRTHKSSNKPVPHQRSCFDGDLFNLILEEIVQFFEFRSWDQVLCGDECVFVDSVITFYANFREGANGNLWSQVNYQDVRLNAKPINKIFCCKDHGSDIVSHFFNYDKWPTTSNLFDRLNLASKYFEIEDSAHAPDYNLDYLSPKYPILHNIIRNNIIPTVGHRTTPNRMSLYIFYCMAENIKLNFGHFMIEFMKQCTLDCCHNLGYDPMLTKIWHVGQVTISEKPQFSLNHNFYDEVYFRFYNMVFHDGRMMYKSKYDALVGKE